MRDHPELFFEDALGLTLLPHQERILKTAIARKPLVVVGCNKAGKDYILAALTLWFWFTHVPSKSLYFLPTESQSALIFWEYLETFWNRASSLFSAMGRFLHTGKVDGRKPEHFIVRRSQHLSEDALSGFHGIDTLVIVNEAQYLTENQFDFLWTTRNKSSIFVLSGNPIGEGRMLKKAAKKELFDTIQIDGEEIVQWQEERDPIAGLIDRDWIDAMRELYGETSPVYRRRVRGHWVEESDTSTFNEAMLAKLVLPIPEENEPLCTAWDIAEAGRDLTAGLTLSRNAELEIAHRIKASSETNLMRTVGLIADYYRRFRYSFAMPAYIDAIGVGAGIAPRLREIGINAIAVKVSKKEKPMAGEPDFASLGDALKWRLSEKIKNGVMRIENEQRLLDDLVSLLRYDIIDSRGMIKFMKKEKIRAEIGRSPDYGDALVLAQAHFRRSKSQAGAIAL